MERGLGGEVVIEVKERERGSVKKEGARRRGKNLVQKVEVI